MPPISLDHCWDVSTAWLESSCKLNWLDMIWKGTHLSIKGLIADNAYQSENQVMRSKDLSAELRAEIVSRHRSGEGYYISSSMKVPKSTVASIILKWKKFGTTRTLPRAGRSAKPSYLWKRALSRLVTKHLMVTLVELHDNICRWEKPTKDKHHCNTPPIWVLWHCGQTQPLSIKTHENTWNLQNST